MSRLSTDDDRFPVRRSALRRGVIAVAGTAALATAPLVAAFADGQNGPDWRQHGQRPAWLWNSWQPGAYGSVPPVIYPALGYSSHPVQPPDALPTNVSFPLSHQ